MSGDPRRIALVATYDERSSIVPLIEQLLALPLDLAVLVVDDSSPDGTAGAVQERFAAEPRVRLHSRPRRLGYGSAMRTGFLIALAERFDTIVTLDADLSHDPGSVPALVAAAEASAGLAVGSRYLGGVRVRNWQPWRLALSRAANAYVRRILGLTIRDCTSGFRAYTARALRAAAVEGVDSRGYAFLVEVLHAVVRREVPVIEVPIVYFDRRGGRSKMSWGVILESVFAPLRVRWLPAPGPGVSSWPGWRRQIEKPNLRTRGRSGR